MEDLIISVLKRALIAGTPLLLGTLGEITAERSGILNLGVEGMMSLGAISGFMVTFATGNPYLGLAVSVLAGAAFSLIHSFVSVTLKANQVVSGLALTMTGLGVSGMLGKSYIGRPLSVKMMPVELPLLHRIPFAGEVLFSQDIYFYLSIILGVILWFVLRHTKAGIAVRSVGENPKAAESQGIRVSAVRYACVAVGGAFAGMAGSHISIAYSKSWIEGITVGRGWIVIALTIFAMWNPLRAFYGAFLFGGIFVLQYILQPLGISPNLLAMLPYVTTLGILVLYGIGRDAQRRMHAPAMLGEAYHKDER